MSDDFVEHQRIVQAHDDKCEHAKRYLWPKGEWTDERPNFWASQILKSSLVCLAIRSEFEGHWCGYVGVPVGHPVYGVSYQSLDLDCHGGLTYSGRYNDGLFYTGQQRHWVGFDCAHWHDIVPGMESIKLKSPQSDYEYFYRNLEYVREQCYGLERQLIEMEKSSNALL